MSGVLRVSSLAIPAASAYSSNPTSSSYMHVSRPQLVESYTHLVHSFCTTCPHVAPQGGFRRRCTSGFGSGGGSAVRCPYCRHPESRVVDSREADEGAAIRRRRSCQE